MGSYDKYVGVSDTERDPEFIENWVVQMDLLCKPSFFIGMIGFSFFFGVVIAMFFVPQYSELNGKKDVFCASLLLSIFAQAGLLYLTSNIELICFFMLLLGLSFPGKHMIGLAYILDFFPKAYVSTRLLWFRLLDYP